MNEELCKAISLLLIQNSHWQKTNTPAEALANHMVRSMMLFEATLLERASWFHRSTGVQNANTLG
jgi:hypothetical protein